MTSPADSSPIALVLATCNGAAFVAEQIRSLLTQTDPHWRLFVRDDASTDSTPDRLQDWARQEPRITLLPPHIERQGTIRTFASILQHVVESADCNHIALVDQDDIWRPTKLARQRQQLDDLEQCHGKATPILVHHDLEVVNATGCLIQPSFLRWQKLRHDAAGLRTLLAQNFVTGCTIMMNRALLLRALPMPIDAIMHDWWLALIAASVGYIGFHAETLVQYRQHGHNQIGARGYWSTLNPLQRSWRWPSPAGLRDWNAVLQQARALRTRLSSLPNVRPDVHRLVEDYCRLFSREHNRWQRVQGLRRLGVRRQDRLRHALLQLRLLLTPTEAYIGTADAGE